MNKISKEECKIEKSNLIRNYDETSNLNWYDTKLRTDAHGKDISKEKNTRSRAIKEL
jgi:hypothetical protein